LGRDFGLGRRADGVIDGVIAGLTGWEAAAAEAGVPRAWVQRIRQELDARV
jgi:hypothetical protein